MSGERAARRAVLRWALRLVRRDWRQQLLVLLLLTIAVGAAVAGSAMALASNQDPAGQFGSGGGRIQLDGTDPARAQTAIAAARTRFGEVDVVAHTNVAVPGSVLRLDVRDQDPNGIFSHPMVARRQGRYPTGPGEVALTQGAADLLGTSLGSTIVLGDQPAVVVGIVENPNALGERFALVAPGSLSAPASYTVLVDPGPRGPGPAGQPSSIPLNLEEAGTDDGGATVLMLAASTMALSLVGSGGGGRLRRGGAAPPAPARAAHRHRRHRPPREHGDAGRRRHHRRGRRRGRHRARHRRLVAGGARHRVGRRPSPRPPGSALGAGPDHRRVGHRDRRGGGLVAGPDGGAPVGDGRPLRAARATPRHVPLGRGRHRSRRCRASRHLPLPTAEPARATAPAHRRPRGGRDGRRTGGAGRRPPARRAGPALAVRAPVGVAGPRPVPGPRRRRARCRHPRARDRGRHDRGGRRPRPRGRSPQPLRSRARDPRGRSPHRARSVVEPRPARRPRPGGGDGRRRARW